MDLSRFNRIAFLPALKALFEDLQVPVNYLADEPTSARTILKDTWKDNAAFNLMKDVYFLGIVDDAAFAGNKSMDTSKIQSDYDGVLIFGVTLSERENNRLPTRSQLAEIARAFNREYFYTPVIVVFQYNGYLAFANTERLEYKQKWREGEKAGKVSLLRDIDITNPHAGHLRILNDLKIPETGKNKVDSFSKLYAYWQDVFSVSILNKKFYQELSNWYFWAVKEVHFPSEPTVTDEHLKKTDLATLKQEHNAKNVIRLLTRFLFVWFVKEKKLIPEELFDIDYLKDELLKDLSPVRYEGLFKEANIESVYYKAILQNLFFASLNCPIEPSENGDNRKRGFRLKDNYGQHRDANYLMRYQDRFKNPEKFLKLINSVVPFLNGGLFECLDNKTDKIYIDGFSDNLVKPHQLIVPDYLFFGFDQEVDLSGVVGISTKAFKNARVKGLIPILESYKFTIAENTPIEEDVALDPELLGKVFENLLASYNPETKTTARKQTGSFYTPREIVNYMVDESLIAYLKNSVKNWDIEAEKLDKQLHELLSYDDINPFAKNDDLQKQIIHALDNCKILDPACGSGAFPMGILQKMVHVLQKVDPENKYWQELQLNKAVKETEGAFVLTDKKEREQKLIEINDAFDEKINDPDYARKLFLVEDCIYGVDIQPIATQISKLRFFISLVVDQKVDKEKPNFGIRALPNLETKFVAANALIGIDKPEAQKTLFDNQEIKELEHELKNVRHRLFSAKSPATKRRLRDKDKEIREKIGKLLVAHGWGNETAKQLAGWDPYDQNASSPFFDPEWMFGITDGFDVVIGNPPYRPIQKYELEVKKDWSKQDFKTYANSGNIYFLFYEKGLNITKANGSVMFITSNQWMRNVSGEPLRKYFLSRYCPEILIDFRGTDIFENVAVLSNILLVSNKECNQPLVACDASIIKKNYQDGLHQIVSENAIILKNLPKESWLIFDKTKHELREVVINAGKNVEEWGLEIYRGILTGYNEAFYLNEEDKNRLIELDNKNSEIIRPMLRGKDLVRYSVDFGKVWLIFSRRGIDIDKYPTIKDHLFTFYKDLKPKNDSKEKFGRKPGKYEWYEIQDSINYYKKFDEPKMIFMNMSKDLIFSYDPKGEFLTNQKCFIVTGKNIRYLTAFFNSKFFSYFFKDNFPELLGDVREVSKVYFEKIPVKLPENVKVLSLIEQLVEALVYIKVNVLKQLTNLDQIIQGIIIELYFPVHMKERNIHILQFVEKDLEEVMQGREFDQLTDDQKEKIINRFHARWTDPKSEIVKRINSFAEKSPEILKPILESK